MKRKKKKNLKNNHLYYHDRFTATHSTGGMGKTQRTFKGTNVYIYLKSQDQTWYEDLQGKRDPHASAGRSVDWSEFCHFPGHL